MNRVELQLGKVVSQTTPISCTYIVCSLVVALLSSVNDHSFDYLDAAYYHSISGVVSSVSPPRQTMATVENLELGLRTG